MADDDWKTFEISKLLTQHAEKGLPYLEFLREPTMSCGLYRLAAGAPDLQSPHDEDEVYVVLEGRGRMRVEGEERTVSAGSVLYVRATADHSFFEVEEDMTLLVFFASGGPSED